MILVRRWCARRVEARATKIHTYDGRQIVIPNAELLTNAVVVNTAKTPSYVASMVLAQ
jgi:small-conductance mechanosensitive channel